MKVRIILRDGYHDRFGVDHACGDIADLPDAIAEKLIRRRMAVSAPAIETQQVQAKANTAKRTGKTKPKASK